MNYNILLFLNDIGTTELLLIVAIAIILFGGKKIPDLMRGLGKGVKEFKDALSKDYSHDDANNKSESTDVKDKNKI